MKFMSLKNLLFFIPPYLIYAIMHSAILHNNFIENHKANKLK